VLAYFEHGEIASFPINNSRVFSSDSSCFQYAKFFVFFPPIR
jgi:hypothetical protein